MNKTLSVFGLSALLSIPAVQAGDTYAHSGGNAYSGGKSPVGGKMPLGSVQPSGAAASAGKFFVRPFLGTKLCLAGNHTGAAWAKVDGVDVDSNPTDFCDIYGDNLTGGGLEIGYATCEMSEIFLGISSYSGDADSDVRIGELGAGDLLASYDDYEDLGLYVGIKYGANPHRNGWGTHAKLTAGVRMVDEIGVSLSGGLGNDLEVFDDSVVFEGQALVGVSYGITDNVALGLEGGLAYQTGLDDQQDELSEIGMSNMNLGSLADSDGLLSVPLRLFVDIRF